MPKKKVSVTECARTIIDLSKDFDMPIVRSDDKGRINLSVAFAFKSFRVVSCRGKKLIVLEVVDDEQR